MHIYLITPRKIQNYYIHFNIDIQVILISYSVNTITISRINTNFLSTKSALFFGEENLL